jgi:hypothetical protein
MVVQGRKACILQKIDRAEGDLQKKLNKLFTGQVNPIRVIVNKCNPSCFRFDFERVIEIIEEKYPDSRPVEITLEQFIKCVNG